VGDGVEWILNAFVRLALRGIIVYTTLALFFFNWLIFSQLRSLVLLLDFKFVFAIEINAGFDCLLRY